MGHEGQLGSAFNEMKVSIYTIKERGKEPCARLGFWITKTDLDVTTLALRAIVIAISVGGFAQGNARREMLLHCT